MDLNFDPFFTVGGEFLNLEVFIWGVYIVIQKASLLLYNIPILGQVDIGKKHNVCMLVL